MLRRKSLNGKGFPNFHHVHKS
uniref:Uncharacterized protein n=1 Tax=Rhizophora mucronata TaxID=61149 RepID=A0A2P2NBJ8_RHIMU